MPSGYSKKELRQNSGTSVLRYREPFPNPKITDNVTQFIFDYKTLKPTIPDRLKNVLVESTQSQSRTKRMATNKNNRSAVFGPLGRSSTGGMPDDPGRF